VSNALNSIAGIGKWAWQVACEQSYDQRYARITNTDNFVYIPTQVCPLLKLFRIGRKAIKSALVAVVVVLTISSKALHHADNVNKHCSDPEVVRFQMAQCRGTGVLTCSRFCRQCGRGLRNAVDGPRLCGKE